MRTLPPELQARAKHQQGLLSISQLAEHRFLRREIDRRISRGEWQAVSQRVVAINAQPLARLARLWAASLHFDQCALAGPSVLELRGLPTPNDQRIHLIGPRQGRVPPLDRCVLHSSTRHETTTHDPDCVALPLAVLQAMRWAASDDQAIFHATWVLQRGLVRLEDLQLMARGVNRGPGSERMKRRLGYLAPGIDSLGEHYFSVECRKRGLPEPARQRVRLDSCGQRRYMDAEFTSRGRSLVVEVDGAHHLDPSTHEEDQFRANEIALQGPTVLRVSVRVLKRNPEPFFTQLRQGLFNLSRAA